MMELKFRAYKKATKFSNAEMFDVGVLELDDLKAHDYYNFCDNYAGTTAHFEDGQDIIMQFTGLKDKNGKDIYCHDIIHSIYSDGSPCRHIVKWVDSDARFRIFDFNTDRECGGISQEWIHENNKEVIGNIHENPELLK